MKKWIDTRVQRRGCINVPAETTEKVFPQSLDNTFVELPEYRASK